MSESLASTTCRIHFDRPASARCPGCRQFYCAECITEHDGKLTCASCLAASREEVISPEKSEKKNQLGWLQPMPIIHSLIAFLFFWLICFAIAQVITNMPDSFHDGTIWESAG